MRLALLALALLAATGCQPRDAAESTSTAAPAKPGAPAAPTVPAFAYDEADIAGLQQRMASGAVTSHALTQAYLDRIAAIDKAGPQLN